MFRSNKLNLVISIVAAIAIWAFVVTLVNPTLEKTIRSVPVELTNLSALAESGLTVSLDTTYTVDVRVSGTRSNLARLEDGDIKAVADMTGFKKGVNRVTVDVSSHSEIEVIDVQPQRLEVEVEDLVSVAKPVVLKFTEAFPEGVEPGFITILPEEIEVYGTKDNVDAISYVEALIDSANLGDEEVTMDVEAIPVRKNGDKAYFLRLSQDMVEVTATLCHVKEVPFNIEVKGDPPENVSMINVDKPSSVYIRGSAEALKNIGQISAKSIDISNLQETTIITPELNLPDGVELADRSIGLAVTIEMEGVIAKSIMYTADEIEITGQPEGDSAHVNTGSITVIAYGIKSVLDDLGHDDIVPFIDLSTAGNSTAGADEALTVPVQFKFDKKLTKIEATPDQVRVTVVNAEPPPPEGDLVEGGDEAPDTADTGQL